MNKSQLFHTAHSLRKKFNLSMSDALKVAYGRTETVYQYSKDEYWGINLACNQGKITNKINKLSAELSLLNTFKGKVYRGIEVDSVMGFYNEIKGSKYVSFKAFTSTSKSQKKAFCGNVQFIIESKTGKDISSISARPSEEEVLFNRGTSFLVKKIEFKNYKLIINLIEK